MFIKFLFKIDLVFLLRKTRARLNLKIILDWIFAYQPRYGNNLIQASVTK